MHKIETASVILLFAWLLACPAGGEELRYELQFPDLPGYVTLACDLHMHTMFSDGAVWPSVRVDEAWRQGLDAIAITDHIEYQPHKDDVPTKHERPYELALGTARTHGLLLVKAAEITRDTPPGHFNALFLDTVAALDTKEFLDVIRRANEQKALVVWNHQGWKGPEQGCWLDVHTTIYDKKWFHAMEICNGDEYYPDAHKWALEKNLTMIGATDSHDPDLRTKSTSADHRTMTLVFAKERTLDGLKEALHAGRTVVWYKDQLIGRRELLEPFWAGCVRVGPVNQRSGDNAWVEIRNLSNADIRLERNGNLGPPTLGLPAGATVLVKLGGLKGNQSPELKYTAANFLIAPGTGLPVVLKIPGPESH
jgi:hypothetical protein